MKASILTLAFALSMHCIGTAHATTPEVFRYLNNALGLADRQGCLNNWWHADEKIALDEKTELPVRFLFNSNQRYVADGCLGHGWWFPILESTVVQSEEGKVLMHGPGGFMFYLFQDPKDATSYGSLDRVMEGKLLPGDKFEVQDKRDGWKFRYHKGRLQEAITPAGDELKWVYEENRVVKVLSKKKGELMTARYNSAGLLERFDLLGKKYWTEFGYTGFPVMTKVLDKVMPVKMIPSVGSVKDSKGFDGKIGYDPNNEMGLEAMQVTYKSLKTGKIMEEAYKWASGSGHILASPRYTYAISFPDATRSSHPKVVRVDKNGKTESYSYDTTTGILQRVHADGRLQRMYYVLTPGPSYSKLRKTERFTAEGQLLSSKVFNYDQSGAVVRDVLENAGKPAQTITRLDSGDVQVSSPTANSTYSTKDNSGVKIRDAAGKWTDLSSLPLQWMSSSQPTQTKP